MVEKIAKALQVSLVRIFQSAPSHPYEVSWQSNFDKQIVEGNSWWQVEELSLL